MEIAELVLDYIRALVWPSVLTWGLWRFHGPIADFLRRLRTLKGAGIEATADAVDTAVQEIEDSAETATDPGESEEQRRAAIESLVKRAAELGRLQGEVGVGTPDVKLLWDEAGPRVVVGAQLLAHLQGGSARGSWRTDGRARSNAVAEARSRLVHPSVRDTTPEK